jgi:tRNA threonylcarbamoyladenosine biosynthesis protein TsaE
MTDDTLTIDSRTPEETEAIGAKLVELLPEGGVIALRGELASGKTCLVRGMAGAVGHPELLHSPTFTLVNEYGDDPKLYHLDLYRLGDPEEVAELGYEEIFESGELCAVEWAERAEPLLPRVRLDISLEHTGGDGRRLTLANRGLLPKVWRDALTRIS